ncbi:hypothetical protein ACFPM0_17500 [Pseudonocardia sulfidoxydans]|uniref:hypothetical protein n=1 Tax=Pseudonocardia sulfidoxydans TaxID=54011 RepID=UPI00361F1211
MDDEHRRRRLLTCTARRRELRRRRGARPGARFSGRSASGSSVTNGRARLLDEAVSSPSEGSTGTVWSVKSPAGRPPRATTPNPSRRHRGSPAPSSTHRSSTHALGNGSGRARARREDLAGEMVQVGQPPGSATDRARHPRDRRRQRWGRVPRSRRAAPLRR